IPTYNRPYYFELALKSVLMQTYKNIEIIVCDDSTNNETKKLIQPYLKEFSQIRYYKNPKNLGQFQNDLLCMEYAKGEFVNFLMDDDLFHLQKIEKMMDYFQGDLNNEITLITSHRQLIDDEENLLEDNKETLQLFDKDVVVDGIEFGELLLTAKRNYIGEPTTVLFRKAALVEPFGMFMGREYGCNVDMASWFNLLSKGKIAYISESLSYFRMHAGQQQQSGKMVVFGMCDYLHQILYAQERGFFKKPMKYAQVIQNWLKRTDEDVEYISRSFSDLQNTEMIFEYKKLLEEKLSKVCADLPLVSILIPAFNRPYYLELALQSALKQTYLNIEIIICDDSTNDEVEKMVQPYLVKSRNLQYYRNGEQLVAGNVYKLMDLAKGEFVAFLNDDDLFDEHKVQKMVAVLYDDSSITLVTSYRKMIDENGEIIKDSDNNRQLFDKDILIDGKELGTYLLMATFNGIGEPSTAMFRKSSLTEKFGLLNGFQYSSINDLASWMLLMSKGNVYYFAEPLSFTRIHASQNQLKPEYISLGIKEWFLIIQDSRQFGFLNMEDDFKTALRQYLALADGCTKRTISLNGERFLEEIGAERFIEEAKSILQNHVDQFKCGYCNHGFNEFKPYPDKFDFPGHLFEMDNKYGYFCPNCGSMDRERLYKLFIETETDLLCANKEVLHIAPEKNFRNLLLNNKKLDYVCGDLYPQDRLTKRIDITDIKYPENTFDVVLCSHVLEHVPDDRLAMKEFYRVLKPGGWGIMQVPICISIDETYEDFSITTPEGRKKAFGQDDHVRIYEKNDYIRRLVETGFEVELYNFAEKYGEKEASKYGFSKTDNLYLVHKK
ncbi:MAG: glycosyltransferase, partial [Mobilitalea sp.]